ncbi:MULTISPECIES: ABC transporter permease subunit [Streptomyces]|uniref:ABC transporter permease subunit n=1 Tax=Streptomyces solicathayae TaxID=3081768 RepID=A0ABZ0LS37_9ACTN|nr:ABC transporter permease subunit [Streptomyces sp. HUAS YS2]WOX22026.1 ABC transporter permease subunit [Streptomyces sp. HUAS YS2]
MTTPYAQQGSASYVSPIPVRRAHLGDALASEWTKIRSVRSTLWTLGVLVLLMLSIGLGVGAIVAASGVDPENEPALGLGFFGMLPGSICVITLGVLTIASEYGTGMIRTTLTACPSRGRVLIAKAIVFFLLVFAITTVTATLVAVAQYAMIGGPEPSASAWLRATVGAGFYVATLGLLALAVGAVIRHSAGAITIMIGLLLLPLVAALFMFSEPLKDVQEALFTYAIPSQMLALYADVPPLGTDGPAGWEPVGILVAVTALAFGGAYAALQSRDV